MSYWLKILLILCAIWIVAAGAIFFVRSSKPTAQSIAAYIQKHRLDSQTGSSRRKTLDHVTDMLNHITLEERQKLREEGVTPGFFRSLTAEEQSAFLDATLPTGFRQLMESFNTMAPAKRKEFVERALTDMRNREGKEPARNVDDKNTKKIIDQGLRSFYSESSADVKLDFAPLIEQMQKNLQGP